MNVELIGERNKDLSPIEQILANRGVNKTAEEFFDISWDCVNSPFNLDNIDKAIELFLSHINNNSKIAVLIDTDIDGYSSAAFLFNYCEMQKHFGDWQGKNFELVPVYHKEKIHGLNDKEVMRAIRDEIKPQLFVIPDASGSDEQYKALTDLGIDILVLDHHATQPPAPNDKVVVVNNQHSERYTNKDFSGVGIVWQFCRALDSKLSFVCADTFLDLVAIGNIGDVMDLRSDETRFVCQEGLKMIESPFLEYMKFTSYSLRDKDFNPTVVAFNIAPMFNAVCRIGESQEREILFKCLLNEEANVIVPSGKRGHLKEEVRLVEEGCRLAANARSRQNLRKDRLIKMIDDVVSEEKLFKDPVIILGFDDFKEDYRSLSGLVASGLSDFYDRPVILTFKNPDGSYAGSLRSPNNIPIYTNFKTQCEESGLCNYVAGHEAAAGIEIKPGCVEALRNYFQEKFVGADPSICQKVDFILDADDPSIPDIIQELAEYSNIWGTNLEAPRIAIKNVKISPTNLRLMGTKKNTLKISLPEYELINFNSSLTEYESIVLPFGGDIDQFYLATVICHDPNINIYNNKTTLQLQFSEYSLDKLKCNF